MTTLIKDPDAKLDYGVRWKDWLSPGDVIVASDWTITLGTDVELSEGDLTETVRDFTDTTTTIWVTGGTLGARYTLTNHVTTEAGREDEYSFLIHIQQK